MLAPVLVAALLGGAVLTSCDSSPRPAPTAAAASSRAALAPSTTPDALRVCEEASQRLARGQAVLSAVSASLSAADRALWTTGEPPGTAVTCTYAAPRPVQATASPGCTTRAGAMSFPSVTFLVDPATGRSQRLPDLPAAGPCAS